MAIKKPKGITYEEKECKFCGKKFKSERWKNQRYCSLQCGVDANKGITYEEKECKSCGKKFKSERWKNQRYCSRECGIEAIRGVTYEDRVCLQCGKKFKIQPFKSNKYCSKKCMGLSYRRRGMKKRNPALIDSNGRYLHRLIMEKKLKRKLLPTERVHHIDMNNKNNNLDNLYLYNNESNHQKGHHTLSKLVSYLLLKGIIKFKEGKYILTKNEKKEKGM